MTFKQHYGVRIPNARGRRRWAALRRYVRRSGYFPATVSRVGQRTAWQIYRGTRNRRAANFWRSRAVILRLAQRFYRRRALARWAKIKNAVRSGHYKKGRKGNPSRKRKR